jgi:NADPH2:quinone reductase
MKAAVIHTFGRPPRYEDFPDPIAAPGESLVTLRAAGLHPLVKLLAAGTHYSSDGVLPRVAGLDGVAHTSDGTRFYVSMLPPPYGTLAERATTASLRVPVPAALSDARCAALINPGMSAWLTLTMRAPVVPGETVLVLGATGAAGGLAVQIAKRLGAGRVIAAGRNAPALARLEHLGADATVRLDGSVDAMRAAIVNAAGRAGVQLIVDYVWGAPAEAAIAAVTRKVSSLAAPRVRLVQVGSSADPTITLSSAPLRSFGLAILGSGLGTFTMAQMGQAMPALLAIASKLTLDIDEVPLADIERVWDQPQGPRRIVLMP